LAKRALVLCSVVAIQFAPIAIYVTIESAGDIAWLQVAECIWGCDQVSKGEFLANDEKENGFIFRLSFFGHVEFLW
jgi:hypothetical protein